MKGERLEDITNDHVPRTKYNPEKEKRAGNVVRRTSGARHTQSTSAPTTGLTVLTGDRQKRCRLRASVILALPKGAPLIKEGVKRSKGDISGETTEKSSHNEHSKRRT